jgi:hypothetical protein
MCVLALGAVGCSETAGTGGSDGDGGSGGTGGADLCEGVTCQDTECKTDGVCNPSDGMCDFTLAEDGTVCTDGECLGGVCAPVGAFPCTEQGIRDAIAEGGGPHTFACDGPTTIVTEATIFIDNDVILDGEGQLTLVGDEGHAVLVSPQNLNDPPATAELRGFRVIGGAQHFLGPLYAVYIAGEAALTLTDSTVSGSLAAGIEMDGGTLTLVGSSVSNNENDGIISQGGTLTILNSTVSDNRRNVVSYSESATLTVVNSTISGGEVGISNLGQMTISNTTIASEGQAFVTSDGDYVPPPEATFANTIVSGGCEGDVANHVTSNGYNIESPGNTCGFDHGTDLVNITEGQLDLGPLDYNGGPTMTHALLTEPVVSVAIDVIPAEDCVDAEGAPLTTDQRGLPRPETSGTMCDVGAFEVQPED